MAYFTLASSTLNLAARLFPGAMQPAFPLSGVSNA
jgi:hypothetical protein